jgi:hypothetical protein
MALRSCGIGDIDVLVAVGAEHFLDLYALHHLAHEGLAGAGVVLVAGHAGDGVVQHHGDDLALVVGYIHGAGHAAVEEGGVAHHAEHGLVGDAGGSKALAMPMATEKPPPMQTLVSMADRGADAPRV